MAGANGASVGPKCSVLGHRIPRGGRWVQRQASGNLGQTLAITYLSIRPTTGTPFAFIARSARLCLLLSHAGFWRCEVDLYHVDFATIVAIWMAGSILLIFALALAARFALKPVLDSVARLREARVSELERRFTRLERSFEQAANPEMIRSGHSS